MNVIKRVEHYHQFEIINASKTVKKHITEEICESPNEQKVKRIKITNETLPEPALSEKNMAGPRQILFIV